MDTPSRIREFTCPEPECRLRVTYDPDDPMYHAGGAMLRRPGLTRPSIVYLACPRGHRHRYQVEGA